MQEHSPERDGGGACCAGLSPGEAVRASLARQAEVRSRIILRDGRRRKGRLWSVSAEVACVSALIFGMLVLCGAGGQEMPGLPAQPVSWSCLYLVFFCLYKRFQDKLLRCPHRETCVLRHAATRRWMAELDWGPRHLPPLRLVADMAGRRDLESPSRGAYARGQVLPGCSPCRLPARGRKGNADHFPLS